MSECEEKIKDAMLQYHNNTLMPNLKVLQEACQQFYLSTNLEHHYTQIQLDMVDSRLRTLEARLGNKSLLLKGLPSFGFTKSNLDYNLKYWCQQANVPWDCLIASSALLAYEEMEDDIQIHMVNSGFTSEFFHCIYLTLPDDQPLMNWISNDLARVFSSQQLWIDIFTGTEFFNNQKLKDLSAACTNFTDCSYWQIAHVFVQRPKQKSQLQVPNDQINELWSNISSSIEATSQMIEWSITRHWNKKGNSMETLLFLIAEAGHHLLFWQTLYIVFMAQHSNLRAPWVVQVY